MPTNAKRRFVYRIEKFLPTNCPKCDGFFEREGRDYTLTTPSKSGTENIQCQKCGNKSPKIMLETRSCLSLQQAVTFVNKECFVNLIKVLAGGVYIRQDIHVIYYQKSDRFGHFYAVKPNGKEKIMIFYQLLTRKVN